MGRMLLFCMLTSCAAAPREVVLLEMQNSKVENVPLGLSRIEPTRIWRQGVRVSVDFATLLRLDVASSSIRPEKVSVGDEITVGKTKWSVVSVEPGTGDTRGRVILRSTD